MAHFIGIAGDFQKERAITRRLNAIMLLFLVMSGAFFLFGFATAKFSILWSVAALAIVIPAFRFFERVFNKYLRNARFDERGASGEQEIIPYLKELPDSYTVICDLDFADSYGNIDHLVIGPTGIFAIDVKDWRGTVAPDGKGELLCNGQPTDKPQVKYFARRIMDLKDRLKALTKLDPYIQCLFVFPRTRVDANWGTTGAVHCIRMVQLHSYITNAKGGKPVPAADLPRLISAAKALKEIVRAES